MSQGSTSLPPRSGSRGSVPPTKAKKPKKPKKKRSFFRTFIKLLIGLLLIVAAVLGYLVYKTNDAISTIGVNDNKVEEVPVGESVKAKPVAMVLMGIDTREKGGSLNTDVMMVAAFNPTTKKATVVSIPRDTYVDVKDYRGRKANSYYASFYNVARQEGKDKEDAELAAKKVVKEVFGDYFDINIQYAATINFQGFSDVVDAVGGVKVNVDMRMKYTDSHDGTNIDLEPGIQVLDGKKALDFVRYRKSNGGGEQSSDFDRNRRQSEVVSAILDKLLSLGGVPKVGSVIDAAANNISVDMPKKEISRMLEKYFTIRSNDITFLSLEGTWKSPHVIADETSLANVKAELNKRLAE
ncbi:LCP family protein [Paenibacillus sp. GSMTC-2017]|uniref:LCP family protein n=1 Tax=Paenibacillus sp. GSMTC-2017 TaxID=2794350 RepID=UPI0018D5C087|nr:LCP family protein [Paenibacillus sp. GSMTC-2017]MBH5316924.1 LCP family protein [Paenibacillus sp. GSMTC-2017]